MSWDKKLVLYILLPILLVAGISYALHQVAAANDSKTHVENSEAAAQDVPPLSPHLYESESRPTVAPGSWLMMALAAFVVTMILLFTVEGIPKIITRIHRRWRKS